LDLNTATVRRTLGYEKLKNTIHDIEHNLKFFTAVSKRDSYGKAKDDL